ncbi:MAG: phosphatidylserine/phosphatidylglycerophosphate/cardiolipin synthase family protein [Pseudobdellovibrionaceae bacterium]
MNLLFENLHREVSDLVQTSQSTIELYSPYISCQPLTEILKAKKAESRVAIVTTWRIADIAFGASDLSIYPYCKKNGIFLFLNQDIHLKTFVADYRRLLTGSANLTGRALGLSKKANYETLVRVDDPPQPYLVYLSKIRKEATLVTDEIAAQFEELYKKFRKEILDHRNLVDEAQFTFDTSLDSRKSFLISALPMSRSIEQLFKALKGETNFDDEVLANARHDIANYELENLESLDYQAFQAQLGSRFFQHPFIAALCKFIDQESRRFGAIKEWVQNTCTDVPVPSRRTLTDNVQVLYSWLVELGPDKFEVTRPNHSEIISTKKKS